MDIAFVLDGSSSLHEEANFEKELSFVTDVVSTVRMSNDETRVAIVKFSTDATLEVPFNMYHSTSELKEKVESIYWEGGNTHLDKALNMLITDVFTSQGGARPNVEKMVVVVTDGVSTNPRNTASALQKVHKQGLNMFAIGRFQILRYICFETKFDESYDCV